jgi:hypothetical protein
MDTIRAPRCLQTRRGSTRTFRQTGVVLGYTLEYFPMGTQVTERGGLFCCFLFRADGVAVCAVPAISSHMPPRTSFTFYFAAAFDPHGGAELTWNPLWFHTVRGACCIT